MEIWKETQIRACDRGHGSEQWCRYGHERIKSVQMKY